MTQKTRRRGFLASSEGLKKLEARMREKGYTQEKLAEEADVVLDRVKRLCNPQWGKKIQKDGIEAIAKVLDLEPPDIVDGWYPPGDASEQQQNSPIADLPDWRKVCHAMLKEQQDKQRLRRRATEMGFEVNVHVPLGLVERKQQQRRDGNVERERVYELEKEVIAKTYQHDEFLTEVIGQRQARKNKHIAIVGEPGAGKTTLLDAIASFIQSNTEDLPICITLASLQGRTLEDYLLKTWLPEAMGLVNPEGDITSAIEHELIKQFHKDRVWLLLDGVDEMGADSPIQALAVIQKQITDRLGQVRVVLTCRVNVWDASVNNILIGFDTYKTQEITHEQVDQFIQEWFAPAKDTQQGKQLKAKLKETGRERLRELVRNPLRLALLCQTFYLDKQGELPETKAALYEKFTRYFYEWKQNLHPQDLLNQTELKDELHQALGKLALAGINSNARFRLRESLAGQEMGDRLFKLACDVGWLNLVDRNAKTDEPVYAFFHANFQEYFAARAIDDWDYFLPREHNNLNPKPVRNTYPIFEPQWKEVICLWLGREKVSKQHKEEFIKALVEFEDGCWYFYRLRAYLLVAAGIAEFRECSLREEIVGLIVDWSFLFCYPPSTNIDSDKKISDRGEVQYYGFLPARESYDNLLKWLESGWQKSAPSIKAAREVLKETDRETAISLLVALLESNKNTDWHGIALLLGQIDPSHEIVIPLIVDIIVDDFNEPDFIREMVEELQKIDPCNEAVIAFIVEQILNESIFHGDNILQSAESLAKLDPGNKRATAHLIKELQTAENEYNCWLAATSLGKIDLGNKFAIATLVSLIESTKKYCRSKEFLTYPGALDKTVGYDLEDFAFFKNRCLLSARSLGEIDPGNEIAISTLIQLIDPNQNEFILDDETRCYVAESLGRIDPGNKKAIAVLIELIQTTEDRETRSEAVSILEQIGTGNEMAIAALVKLIQAADDDAICMNVAESLGKIDPGNETAITALIELILNGWDEDELAANSLEAILQGNHYPKVVTALHHYMTDRVFKDNFFFYHSCHDVIWRCAQNMSYLDFYQAWHGDSPPVQLLENQFTDIASQLQPTAKTYPITINAQALEGETDTSAIAQELCNQIYLNTFLNEPEIPEVNNAPQLKRLIPQIKKQLQKQNLALILDKWEPNQEQVTFCRKLSDVLHIAWITNQPLEPPLIGFLPNQPNLLNVIQSWINEIE